MSVRYLRPCPFCRPPRTPQLGYEGFCAPVHCVVCPCGARMEGRDEDEVVAKWNARADDVQDRADDRQIEGGGGDAILDRHVL